MHCLYKMLFHILGILSFASLFCERSTALTNYEYFVPEGVNLTGLVAQGDKFTLNGKEITIFSGAFHYFRIHPDYWRDTLKKLRAAGLNTVETYMAWNLHAPRVDVFDFGDLGDEMSPFLNFTGFIELAKEEDMFVILRPGPYICSEWEFGGMPSWLLRDDAMSVRTSYQQYTAAFTPYLTKVAEQIADLTMQQGGPVIAIQIENEYGHFGYDDQPRDKLYLQIIQNLFEDNGLSGLLYFTSDSPANTLDWGSLPGVLMTANFQEGVDENLDTLNMLQPNRPAMVMEYWTGWFDHWLTEVHAIRPTILIKNNLEAILARNASVNFYMFIGGTNFGFLAGANQIEVFPHYTPIVTSYDYDAPLTEAGDYTDKYDAIKEVIAAYNPLPEIKNPRQPEERPKMNLGSFPVQEAIAFKNLVTQFPNKTTVSDGPINMEALDINDNSGQSYGYILYSTEVDLPPGNSTIIIRGHVRDMAQMLVNGEVVTKKYRFQSQLDNFGFWDGRDQALEFTTDGGLTKIDIMVENLGRVNYGVPHYFRQKKGLWEGPVLINEKRINDWEITPMEFRKPFVDSLLGWTPFEGSLDTPSVYRVNLTTVAEANDTFLDMRDWGKGVVFVNGFNLGRYWSAGPTKTLYLPAPLMKSPGVINQFVIFEQYEAASEITLSDQPLLGLSD